MKSSFDLAMERLGGLKKISDKKKELIAEIESKTKAKVAETELAAENKIKTCKDPYEIEKIKTKLASDISSIRDKAEQEKEKIRNQD